MMYSSVCDQKAALIAISGALRTTIVNLSVRLHYHCSVFQAEVAAIEVAVDLLLRSGAFFREVNIHYYSRAGILALSSPTVRSKLVKECLSSPKTASSYFIAGNFKADELARGVTFASFIP